MATKRRELPHEQEALVAVLAERFDDLDTSMRELNEREKERNGTIGELLLHDRQNMDRWSNHLEGVLSDQKRLERIEKLVDELRNKYRDNGLIADTRWKVLKTQWAAMGLAGAVIWQLFDGKEIIKVLAKLL